MATNPESTDGPRSHKETAVSFLHLVSSGKAREAFGALVGPYFQHHNPYFRGDAQSLMTAMEENAAQNPNKAIAVKHAIEEGDMVAVHFLVHHKPGDRGAAIIHIFRFEGERIAEMWDVGQEVPESSPNENGMF